MSDLDIGIDAISFYTPHYYIDLKTVAITRGRDPEQFRASVGQDQMAVPPPGEDIVTMGANAALPIVEQADASRITAVLFATESGIDQSKAAGIYVHSLLGLGSRCRVWEFKQACYGGTAALRTAMGIVAQRPEEQVLVIASDVARYGLGTAGEATQGGGAVAMLVGARPRLMTISPEAGLHAEDVMDFWRPNYRDEALVDGKSSVRIYIKSLIAAWEQYQEQTGHALEDFVRFCYHLPFSRMGATAHGRLAKKLGRRMDAASLDALLEPAIHYNRVTGNSYAASLYVGISSLLDNAENLDGARVGLFSYGSGCMAEFFSAVVTPGYAAHLQSQRHQDMLAGRQELDYETYADFYNFSLPTDGSELILATHETGAFRLTAIQAHKRIYERLV
jgi:hydroxymethylglutaryl-CoA synthase